MNPVAVTVDTLLDTADPNDGLTSLREAITTVQNSGVESNSISFDAALFTGGMKTISLTSALPVLRRDAGSLLLRIDGRPGELTIERNAAAGTDFRVFYVGGNASVTMTGLVVKGGRLFGGTGLGFSGGGIYVDGSLKMEDSTVTDNRVSGDGGGIYVTTTGFLNLINTHVNANRADGSGGGIYVTGCNYPLSDTAVRVKIDLGSEVNDNLAETNGGGIYVAAPWMGRIDKLEIIGAKVNGNESRLAGGGIYVEQVLEAGKFTGLITDSEVNANRSREGNGGALFTGGKLRVGNTHLDDNRGGLAAGYVIAVDTGVEAMPLELDGCTVYNSRFVPPVDGGGNNPASIDAGNGGIQFKNTLIMTGDGNGVKGTVVSLGGNVADNSFTTSTGWFEFPDDWVS